MKVRTDIAEIAEDVGAALRALQDALPAEGELCDAFVTVATFAEVGARLMRQSRPSAVREFARVANIALRMPGGPAGVLLDKLRRVRVAELVQELETEGTEP